MADTYLMTRSHKGELVRFRLSDGRPAVRREWEGWKVGLPGLAPADPDKYGPRRTAPEPPRNTAA